MSDTLETALHLANLRTRVVPCKGKVGISNWAARASDWDRQIKEWFEGEYRDYNLGVVIGDEHAVIDLDIKKGGLANWEQICAGRELPETLTTLTPTGGAHLYYSLPATSDIAVGNDLLAPGVDSWTGLRLLIAPPSLHPETKTAYRFKSQPDWSLGQELIAPMPEWLVTRLMTGTFKREKVGRHPKLVAQAAFVRRQAGLNTREIVDILREHPCAAEKADNELYKIAEWVYERVAMEPESLEGRDRVVEDDGADAGFQASIANLYEEQCKRALAEAAKKRSTHRSGGPGISQ